MRRLVPFVAATWGRLDAGGLVDLLTCTARRLAAHQACGRDSSCSTDDADESAAPQMTMLLHDAAILRGWRTPWGVRRACSQPRAAVEEDLISLA